MNQTAQGLASFGRGPDSMLVHMAPSEVKSLQQLAMAHGGSLTINPQTGLPEAGFLSSLLPMLIGGGLTIASGGALSPMMAGLLTGGGFGLATGSLKKGLMAGLGAYGGGSLGQALAGAGAAMNPTAIAGETVAPAMSTPAQTSIVQNAAVNPNMSTIDLTPKLNLTAGSQPAAGMFDNAATGFKNARAGAEGLFTTEGRNAFLGNAASKGVEATGIGGLGGLMKTGLAAATPMLMDTTTTKQPDLKTDANMGQRYKFSAGSQTPTPTPDVPGYDNQGENFGKEKLYFTPSYTPIDDETARRMYGHASGGPVEDMSNANAIGMNTGYPQAAIDTGAYATPYQQPISRNVVTGTQGAGMNPYTGQAQFAKGGEVDEYTYDPVMQLYIKKGGQGATTVAPIKSISEVREGPGGGSELGQGGSDGYGANSSPMSNSIDGSFGYQALDAYGNALGGMLPGGFLAQALAQSMNPSQVAKAGVKSAQALQDAIAGYTSGEMFGAPPSSASTFGGGGYGISVADGGSGKTSATGAGIAANPMSRDPQQAAQDIANANAATGGGFTDVGGLGAAAAADGAEGGYMAKGGVATLDGGISHLGDYSDGGRLLRGPGDGISDSIPAMIGKKQPARLADGEFVVPARIVSELGNGSTEAGARKLYAMMDRVQKARGKTVGKGRVATNSRSAKYLPA